MTLKRAWSTFTIKSANDDKRIIEGIASTPSTDRMGDVVDPLGAQFKTPMPFLWQHDSAQPIGHVTSAKPNKSGIPVIIQLASDPEPGPLQDRLNEAFRSLQIGLVKGLSIGFSPIEYSFIDGGGINFQKWEWLELSAVTIPANADCSITSIKSADTAVLRRIKGKSEQLLDRIAVKQNATGPTRKLYTLLGVTGDALKATDQRLLARIEALEAREERTVDVSYTLSASGRVVYRKSRLANGAEKVQVLTR